MLNILNFLSLPMEHNTCIIQCFSQVDLVINDRWIHHVHSWFSKSFETNTVSPFHIDRHHCGDMKLFTFTVDTNVQLCPQCIRDPFHMGMNIAQSNWDEFCIFQMLLPVKKIPTPSFGTFLWFIIKALNIFCNRKRGLASIHLPQKITLSRQILDNHWFIDILWTPKLCG